MAKVLKFLTQHIVQSEVLRGATVRGHDESGLGIVVMDQANYASKGIMISI